MTNMSDELKKKIELAVGQAVFNTTNYPLRAQARIMGSDMTKLRNAVTEAVMAALAEHDKDQPKGEPAEAEVKEGMITNQKMVHFCGQVLFFGGVEVSRCILAEGHEGRHRNIFTDWDV